MKLEVMSRKAGAYKSLDDVVNAYNQLEDDEGWTLHEYIGGVCIAVHSETYEDPDVKILIKDDLEYKIVIEGMCIDARVPLLHRNNLQTVLNFARKTQKNICSGFETVPDPQSFDVYHRRENSNIFKVPLAGPRYKSVYRSPSCGGISVKGQCGRCTKLYRDISNDLKAVQRKEKNAISKAEKLSRSIEEKNKINCSEFISYGMNILQQNKQ
ncbi:unnamed protein product [Clavelina lepadiformis]|uniref:Uncharacterized protein n=1 Tax=Clavelina lepadiformis TaxID=159417 RepID=A0ABP0FQU7_CLALP